mmetsp:Transcript_32331/g.71033  ORF Transcript_32331/g.71033 Transcript_32331/m.71033 type:complete len:86 (-) Transcript_32331:408-665(-)
MVGRKIPEQTKMTPVSAAELSVLVLVVGSGRPNLQGFARCCHPRGIYWLIYDKANQSKQEKAAQGIISVRSKPRILTTHHPNTYR